MYHISSKLKQCQNAPVHFFPVLPKNKVWFKTLIFLELLPVKVKTGFYQKHLSLNEGFCQCYAQAALKLNESSVHCSNI